MLGLPCGYPSYISEVAAALHGEAGSRREGLPCLDNKYKDLVGQQGVGTPKAEEGPLLFQRGQGRVSESHW